MAGVLKTTAPSRDISEQLVAIVSSDAPPSCIVHTASEVDGEVRVVDVWESRQPVEDFFQTKLGPAFAQVEVEGQPPELTDTFRIDRG
jgi:hypothetical protein